MLIATPSAPSNALFPLLPAENDAGTLSERGFSALLGSLLDGENLTEAVPSGDPITAISILPPDADDKHLPTVALFNDAAIALSVPPTIPMTLPLETATNAAATASLPDTGDTLSAALISVTAASATQSAEPQSGKAQSEIPAQAAAPMTALAEPAPANRPIASPQASTQMPIEHAPQQRVAQQDTRAAAPAEPQSEIPAQAAAPMTALAEPAPAQADMQTDNRPSVQMTAKAETPEPAPMVAAPAARPPTASQGTPVASPTAIEAFVAADPALRITPDQPAAPSTMAMLQSRSVIEGAIDVQRGSKPPAAQAIMPVTEKPAARASESTPNDAASVVAPLVAPLAAPIAQAANAVTAQPIATLTGTAAVQSAVQPATQARTEGITIAPTSATNPPDTLPNDGLGRETGGDQPGEKSAAPTQATPAPQTHASAALPGGFAANLDTSLRAGLSPQTATTPASPQPQWREPLGQATVRAIESGSPQRIDLILNPPALGKIELTLELQANNHLHAAFTAASPEAQRAIEASLADLRQQLQGNGFTLGEAQVGLNQRDQTAQSGQGNGQGPAQHHAKGGTRQETAQGNNGYDAPPRRRDPERALDIYA